MKQSLLLRVLLRHCFKGGDYLHELDFFWALVVFFMAVFPVLMVENVVRIVIYQPEKEIRMFLNRRLFLPLTFMAKAHMSFIYKLKATFCGRKKEGHFHFTNFLRALK